MSNKTEDKQESGEARPLDALIKCTPREIAEYAVKEGLPHEIESIAEMIEEYGGKRFKAGLADGL